MEKYGIADIGSNTMVLIIYEIHENIPEKIYHISTPAHLIDDVDENRHMSASGIVKALSVLRKYDSILDEYHVEKRWADITEPARITNLDELVQVLSETKFEIYPLTGEQEAVYDYKGSLLTYRDMGKGIAFDVGGGSTELIAFEDNKPITAMSLPYGCIRLSHLPLDTDVCEKEIQAAKTDYPALDTTSRTLIGIGGTIRAIGKLMEPIYHTDKTISMKDFNETYEQLSLKNPVYMESMQKNVKESRIPYLLPGMHMIQEIAKAFNADEILISPTNIREGFLLDMISRESISQF